MLRKQIKFPHELMIYGYDYVNKSFLVGDFTFKGKYSYQKVSFNDVILGFNNIKDNDDFLFKENYEIKRGLFLLSPNLNNLVYKLNKKLIIKSLKEYIYSQNPNPSVTNDNNYYKPIFGVSLYDELINQIDNKAFRYDIRSFHVFYDHKSLMFKRIEFLIKNDYIKLDISIINLFRNLMNSSLVIRNEMLKFIISNNDESLPYIKDKLKKMKYKEIKLLNYLIKKLEY